MSRLTTTWRSFLPFVIAIPVAIAGCSDPPKAPTNNTPPAATTPHAPDYTEEEAAWGKFHSKRFQVTVSLPEGKAWKIDDHRAPELVATHAATDSRLQILATAEEDLMNRQRCEDRANKLGWLPKEGALTTVEDEVHVGPDAYDSRVWVALDAGKPGGGVEGHVFLFGAFLRKCLLVHLTTSVPSAKDEQILAKRLAIAETRIIKRISLDPLRTTDDAQVPRDKPNIRR